MSDTPPLLYFLHIPKTAGTTFGAILERNIPRREMIDVYPGFGIRPDELADVPAEQLARARCIRGHFDFGAHRVVDRPFRYVTFLRRPDQQVRSRWNHARSTRYHPLHRFALEQGLAGFALNSPDNFQLRSLLELEPVNGQHPPLDESHVERALDNLERHFPVVGLADRFDESLVLMQRLIGLESIHYVRRNVRRPAGRDQSAPRASVDDAAARAIEATTRLDRLLCERAIERFDAQVAAVPGFAEALARFREENERYSKKMWLVDAASHRWSKTLRRVRAVVRRVGRRG